MARLILVPNRGLFRGLEMCQTPLANIVRGVELLGHAFLKYLAERLHRNATLWPLKLATVLESHDKDSLSLLWKAKIKGVENSSINLVTQGPEHLKNPCEGGPFIVASEKLHVLKDKRLWLFRFNNAGDLEEECAARILESFSVPNNAERLAGESGKKDVVIGNVFGVNVVDVPMGCLAEIRRIRLLAVRVNIARQNAYRLNAKELRNILDSKPEAAYPTEKVDEPNRFFRTGNHVWHAITWVPTAQAGSDVLSSSVQR